MFYLYFFIIFILAATLRLLCLDKTSGLWYDELIMYNEAILPFLNLVKYVIKNELHFPLYQLILHYWILIFGNSDFILRFLSFLFGFFSCIAAYFISENRKNNLLCMLLFSINSFLIYYSQDIKIYSLLVFFVVLNLVFLIKIYEKNSGYIFWILSSIGLILTYPTSFLYVIFEIIMFLLFRFSKKFLLSSLFLFLISLPAIFVVLRNFGRYTTNPNWFYTDNESFLIIFQNFFTPVLTSLDINSANYLYNFLKSLNFYSFIFIFVPILISIYFIVKSLKNDNINKVIFLSAMLFYFAYYLSFKIYDVSVISRYLIIILPNFLIIIARGFDFKKSSIILISYFILINSFVLFFDKNSAAKMNRLGFRPVSELINKNAEYDDVVIFRNNTEIMDKYLNKKIRKVSLLHDFAFKSEFFIKNEETINNLSSREKRDYIKDYLIEQNKPQNIVVMYGLMYVLMKKNTNLFIVVEKQLDNYNRRNFIELVKDDNLYNTFSFNSLLAIKTLLDIKELSDKNLKFVDKFNINNFVIYEYQKN